MNRIETGVPCVVTGNPIRKLTERIHHFKYGKVDYYFFNYQGDQIDLQNGAIRWANYSGYLCNLWGDFLPPKTTVSGRVKQKFLVLRLEKVGAA